MILKGDQMRIQIKIAVWLGITLCLSCYLAFYAKEVMAAEGLEKDELYSESPRSELISAAKSIIAKDPFPALISLDADGVPRVRTVELRPLGDDLEFLDCDQTEHAQSRPNQKQSKSFVVFFRRWGG